KKKNWGLPGGRIEAGEDFVDALTRELEEELFIKPTEYTEIGDYRYKGHYHRIFGTVYEQPLIKFDRRELLKIGWYSLDEVAAFEQADMLHAGFELLAISKYNAQYQKEIISEEN
ncbi:MAG: NUDIX hydrolase, partial [Pseudomonadota bacterium]